MLRILGAGVRYFALTFGAGFVLGTIRTLWIAPQIGARAAELAEMPVMLVVIVAAARWVVRGLDPAPSRAQRLAIGAIGVGLLLDAEFLLVLPLRNMSIGDYFATLDPVTATAFYLMQVVMVAMPLFVARR